MDSGKYNVNHLVGKTWTEFGKYVKNMPPVKRIGNRSQIHKYEVKTHKMPIKDKHLYGETFKDELFCLEKCPHCTVLIKPSTLSKHIEKRHEGMSVPDRPRLMLKISAAMCQPKRSKGREKTSKKTIAADTTTTLNIPEVEVKIENNDRPPTPGPSDLYEDFEIPPLDLPTDMLMPLPVVELPRLEPSEIFSSPQETKPSRLFSNPDETQPSRPFPTTEEITTTPTTDSLKTNDDGPPTKRRRRTVCTSFVDINPVTRKSSLKYETYSVTESESDSEGEDDGDDEADEETESYPVLKSALSRGFTSPIEMKDESIENASANVDLVQDNSVAAAVVVDPLESIKEELLRFVRSDSSDESDEAEKSASSEVESSHSQCTELSSSLSTTPDKLEVDYDWNVEVDRLNYDIHCACSTYTNRWKHCFNLLDCTLHSVKQKRSVLGRTDSYDHLLYNLMSSRRLGRVSMGDNMLVNVVEKIINQMEQEDGSKDKVEKQVEEHKAIQQKEYVQNKEAEELGEDVIVVGLQRPSIDVEEQEPSIDVDKPYLEVGWQEPLTDVEIPSFEVGSHEPPIVVGTHEPSLEVGVQGPCIDVRMQGSSVEVGSQRPSVEDESQDPSNEVGKQEPSREVGIEVPSTDIEKQGHPIDVGMHRPSLDVEIQDSSIDDEKYGPSIDVDIHESPIDVENQRPSVEVEKQRLLIDVGQLGPSIDVEVQEPSIEVGVQGPLIDAEKYGSPIDVRIQRPPLVVGSQEPPIEVGIHVSSLEVGAQSSLIDVNIPVPSIDFETQGSFIDVGSQEPSIDIGVPEPSIGVCMQGSSVDVDLQESSIDVEVLGPCIDVTKREPSTDIDVQEPSIDVCMQCPSVDVEIQRPSVEDESQDPSIDVVIQGPPVNVVSPGSCIVIGSETTRYVEEQDEYPGSTKKEYKCIKPMKELPNMFVEINSVLTTDRKKVFNFKEIATYFQNEGKETTLLARQLLPSLENIEEIPVKRCRLSVKQDLKEVESDDKVMEEEEMDISNAIKPSKMEYYENLWKRAEIDINTDEENVSEKPNEKDEYKLLLNDLLTKHDTILQEETQAIITYAELKTSIKESSNEEEKPECDKEVEMENVESEENVEDAWSVIGESNDEIADYGEEVVNFVVDNVELTEEGILKDPIEAVVSDDDESMEGLFGEFDESDRESTLSITAQDLQSISDVEENLQNDLEGEEIVEEMEVTNDIICEYDIKRAVEETTSRISDQSEEYSEEGSVASDEEVLGFVRVDGVNGLDRMNQNIISVPVEGMEGEEDIINYGESDRLYRIENEDDDPVRRCAMNYMMIIDDEEIIIQT